jgi:hypothetical protein
VNDWIAPQSGSTKASPWIPFWRGIERIASAIGDSRELEHFARTRLYIRQAALDGRLRIRGRHEIEVAGQDQTNFSDVYTEISSAYWKYSVINVLATGATCEAERQTKPETVYAWGPKGEATTPEGIAHEHRPGAVRDASRMAITGDLQILGPGNRSGRARH